MLSQLSPDEVRAVLKSLEDLYVHEQKGHGDLSITLEHDTDDGGTRPTRGFVVTLHEDGVTLGIGAPNVRHERVPLRGVVRLTIER